MNVLDPERINHPLMEYYRHAYQNSLYWDGTFSLSDKTVIIYCEQGYGDIIQFSRYFPIIRSHCKKLIGHLPPALHGLLGHFFDSVFNDDQDIPAHDCHILSMDLPFLLNEQPSAIPPYLKAPDPVNLSEFTGKKIGICWEGNPSNYKNDLRSCPLRYFQTYAFSDASYFMMQNAVHNPAYTKGAEDFNLYGYPISDFTDLANLMASMDLVITIDSAPLHLAGALGVPAIALLGCHHDERWNLSTWYQSVMTIHQKEMGDWDSCFQCLLTLFGLLEPVDEPVKPNILFTGGIGDILALEPFLDDIRLSEIQSISYATKISPIIQETISTVFGLDVNKYTDLWHDFNIKDRFYYKKELESYINCSLDNTEDWSILTVFPQIERREKTYCYSRFLDMKLADISLDYDYCVVVPDSTNDSPDRGFTPEEWEYVRMECSRRGWKAVVLRTNGEPVPEWCVDLTGQTTLSESIELLKGAKGYLGIDSCLSVLAAKLPLILFRVKTVNLHLLRWKHIYYAPRQTFEFLGDKLTDTSSARL